MKEASEGREAELMELLRALIALTGRQVEATLQIPGGHHPLCLDGVLTGPLRQPLEPELLTLGFAVDAQRLDLHLGLDGLDEVRHSPTGATAATHLILTFADGATLRIGELDREPD